MKNFEELYNLLTMNWNYVMSNNDHIVLGNDNEPNGYFVSKASYDNDRYIRGFEDIARGDTATEAVVNAILVLTQKCEERAEWHKSKVDGCIAIRVHLKNALGE
jgi:hypothetical protein